MKIYRMLLVGMLIYAMALAGCAKPEDLVTVIPEPEESTYAPSVAVSEETGYVENTSEEPPDVVPGDATVPDNHTIENYLGDDYIVEPYSIVFRNRPHESLQEFIFSLEGVELTKCGLEPDEPFDPHNSFIRIHTMTITSADGSIKQEYTDLDTDSYFSNGIISASAPGLSFDDWNFDGYIDASLFMFQGGTSRNSPHYYWLWDVDAGEYVMNKEMENASLSSRLEQDPVKNQIVGWSRHGGWGGIYCYYEFRDNLFTLVRTMEVLVSGEPEDDEWTYTKIIIEDLIDGEMVVTREFLEERGVWGISFDEYQ